MPCRIIPVQYPREIKFEFSDGLVWMVMKECGLQRIPVVDPCGTPMGIVYARDALQHLLSKSEFDEHQLRDYVMGIGYR